MAFKVDLNCDLGESFGNYKIGGDDKIIPLISSANVACGFHAGDPVVMKKTIETAKKNKIGIGAHPGFLDLMGFGRREMKISIDEAKAYVLYQLGALGAFCKSEGVKLQHVKPHGALYNMAAKDYKLSRAICEAVAACDKVTGLCPFADLGKCFHGCSLIWFTCSMRSPIQRITGTAILLPMAL